MGGNSNFMPFDALFYKKSTRRLEFNYTVFLSFVSKKDVRHGYRGGEDHVFYVKDVHVKLIYILYKHILIECMGGNSNFMPFDAW
jgi:hypothetical protein